MKTREGKAKVFTKEELQKVKDGLTGPYNVRNKVILDFLFGLGLRISELVDIKLTDILNNNKSLKESFVLSKHNTKTKSSRTCYLSNNLLRDDLSRLVHLTSSEYLFETKNGRKFSVDGLRNLVRSLFKPYGFVNASSHSGRRTLATNIINKTGNIMYARDILGHKSIKTTELYCETDPSKLASCLRNIEL